VTKSDRSRGTGPRLARRYMAEPKECALLLLRLLQAKEREIGRPLSRFCVSSLSLERMWGRRRITPELAEAVGEWLFRAGRVFFFTGDSYGVILTSAVDGWARLSSKRLEAEINEVLAGQYDFTTLEHLLVDASEANRESGEVGAMDVARTPDVRHDDRSFTKQRKTKKITRMAGGSTPK
jgi:hypothetical protein